MVKDPPFILENYILGFYRARVVSVCYETDLFVSVVSI